MLAHCVQYKILHVEECNIVGSYVIMGSRHHGRVVEYDLAMQLTLNYTCTVGQVHLLVIYKCDVA